MNLFQIMQQAQSFQKAFSAQNPNVNPREYLQRMMNQGKISQQQFEHARTFAKTLGVNL